MEFSTKEMKFGNKAAMSAILTMLYIFFAGYYYYNAHVYYDIYRMHGTNYRIYKPITANDALHFIIISAVIFCITFLPIILFAINYRRKVVIENNEMTFYKTKNRVYDSVPFDDIDYLTQQKTFNMPSGTYDVIDMTGKKRFTLSSSLEDNEGNKVADYIKKKLNIKIID